MLNKTGIREKSGRRSATFPFLQGDSVPINDDENTTGVTYN